MREAVNDLRDGADLMYSGVSDIAQSEPRKIQLTTAA